MAFLPKKRSGEESGGLPALQKEMNSLFEKFFGHSMMPSFFSGSGFAPLLDVVETKDSVEVRAEIPGIKVEDIDITITGDILTFKGEKKSEREKKDENVHLVERSYGSFSRSVDIPSYVDGEKVTAEYKDGILTVKMAKKEDVKGRSVKVQVK